MVIPEELLQLEAAEAAKAHTANVVDEAETEEEEVESTEAAPGDSVTEDVEQVDSEDEAEVEEEEVESETETEDDGIQYLEYVKSGEKLRVDLANPDDLQVVRKALEKQGLEKTAQEHAEARSKSERELAAARVKLEEYKARETYRKRADPYLDILKDPIARQKIATAFRLPPIEYDPEKADLQVERASLKAVQEQQAKDIFWREFEADVATRHELTGDQINMCAQHMIELGLVPREDIPLTDQRDILSRQFDTARSALIGQGKLPNPQVQKVEAEKEAVEKKLKRAAKRAGAVNPTPGRGATSGKASKKRPNLANASADELKAYYRLIAGG